MGPEGCQRQDFQTGLPRYGGSTHNDHLDSQLLRRLDLTAYPFTRSAARRDAAPAINPEIPAEVPLSLLTDYRPNHIDAKDAIAFASLHMKKYYDTRRQP